VAFIDEIIRFWNADEVLDIAPYQEEIMELMETKYSNAAYIFNTACNGVIQKDEKSIIISQGIIENECIFHNQDFQMKSIFSPVVFDYLRG
jgi:hypothetical protein